MPASEPQRKLKQSRLLFAPVDSKAPRKRRLSFDGTKSKVPRSQQEEEKGSNTSESEDDIIFCGTKKNDPPTSEEKENVTKNSKIPVENNDDKETDSKNSESEVDKVLSEISDNKNKSNKQTQNLDGKSRKRTFQNDETGNKVSDITEDKTSKPESNGEETSTSKITEASSIANTDKISKSVKSKNNQKRFKTTLGSNKKPLSKPPPKNLLTKMIKNMEKNKDDNIDVIEISETNDESKPVDKKDSADARVEFDSKDSENKDKNCDSAIKPQEMNEDGTSESTDEIKDENQPATQEKSSDSSLTPKIDRKIIEENTDEVKNKNQTGSREKSSDSPLTLKIDRKIIASSSSESTEEDKHEKSTDSSLTPKIDRKKSAENTDEVKEENQTASLEKSTDSSLTPKIDRKQLVTKKRKLTPLQIAKQQEAKERREEIERIKQEKKRARLEEQEEKKKAKLLEQEEKTKKKQEELEIKKKERDEKMSLKEQEKAMKDMKKEEERLKKEEERLKKEEERKKKEEEKQKKEQEKQKKEEEKLKRDEEKLRAEEEEKERKNRLKEKFVKFFVPKENTDQTEKKVEAELVNSYFSVFQIKGNMKIAPLVRRHLNENERVSLEGVVEGSVNLRAPSLYLTHLKSPSYVCGRDGKTFTITEEETDDCEILSDEGDDDVGVFKEESSGWSNQSKKRCKAKLFQFCENNRPAYYGTWSKKSSCVNGRRPFSREQIFNYDYDSDEDWEEIEAGESLSDSEGEPDDGGDDEVNQYEVDNDVFVPHGYLSDGEGEEDDEEIEKDDKDIPEKEGGSDVQHTETIQKEKLKQKQEEFDLEMKQKTRQLKPKVFGCIWLGDSHCHTAYNQLLNILSNHRANILFGSYPVAMDVKDPAIPKSPSNGDEDSEAKKFVKTFPEKAVPDLIRLVHGNRRGGFALAREFFEFWKRRQEEDPTLGKAGTLSTRKIKHKIQEIGLYERMDLSGNVLKHSMWNVPEEFRSKYDLKDMTPVEWNYILTPSSRRSLENNEEVAEEPTPPPNKSLITKYTKVLGEEEKRKLSSPSPSVDGNAKKETSKAPDSSTVKTPTRTPSSVPRKRIQLTTLSDNKPSQSSPVAQSIASMFKNSPKPTKGVSPTPKPSTSKKNESSETAVDSIKTLSENKPSQSSSAVKSIASLFKNSPKPTKRASPVAKPSTAKKNESSETAVDCITLD